MRLEAAILALALVFDTGSQSAVGLVCTGSKVLTLGDEKFQDVENWRFVLDEQSSSVSRFDELSGTLKSVCENWENCRVSFEPYLITVRADRPYYEHHLLVRFDRKISRVYYSESATRSAHSEQFEGACSIAAIPKAELDKRKF